MKVASLNLSEERTRFCACLAITPEERITAIRKLNFSKENNLKVITAISSLDPNYKVRRTATSILKKVNFNFN
jgi:hypothetical protein